MENRELKYLFSVKGIILSVIALAAAVTGAVFCVNAVKAYGNVTGDGNSVVLSGSQSSYEDSSSPVISYKELSYNYTTLGSTCAEWTDEGEVVDPESGEVVESGLYFISKENLRFCIYDTDSEALCGGDHTLRDFKYMWLNSEDSGFYVVVNLAGENIDLSGYYILARDSSYMYASRVLINCYEAKNVDLSGAVLTGTLLAPYANVKYDDTFVFGQVLSDTTEGNCTTYREIKFSGYYTVMGSQDDAVFVNDCVRQEAVKYLMEHNENGFYDFYTTASRVKNSDLDAVRELDLSGYIIKDNLNSDLAKLTNLESLTINNSNITVLTLADHPALTNLEVNNTPVASLDISGAPSLLRLSLENTAVTSLNIDKNTHLKVLLLSGSPVGKFPKVDLPQLEYLDISSASLDEDHVSGAYFPALKTLVASSNPGLRGLDLPSFAALESIDITDTSVASLAVPENTALTFLRLSGTKLQMLDLRNIKHLYSCECYCDSLTLLMVNRYADKLYTNVTPVVVQAD